MLNSVKFLLIFIFISDLAQAQQQDFTGIFVNRDGYLEVISMLGAQGYQLDIIKNGERFTSEAKDIGGGNLEGTFLRNKEKVAYTINYEKGLYFFSSENSSIPLTQRKEEYNDEAIPKSKKTTTDHRFATGARVFNNEGTFAFNLPDEEWSYVANDDSFTLQKESLGGWIKIFSHTIPTLKEAKKDENVAMFLQGGNYQETTIGLTYGKISYIRQYRGTDAQGRQMRFYILTIVSPEGTGLHIISGAPAGKFEPAYERYAKVIADSVEFIH